MKNKRLSLCVGLIVFYVAWASLGLCSPRRPGDSILFGSALNEAKTHKVGENVVKGRRAALHFPLNGYEFSHSKIRDYMLMVSRHNLEETAFFGALSNELEIRFFNKVKSMRVPIVSRTTLSNLRRILQTQALISPLESARRDLSISKIWTPKLEEMLFGAYGCVFAAVGFFDGSSRYGEVVIRFRNAIQDKGWATPWSGRYFLNNFRNEDTRLFEERIESGDIKEIDSDTYLQFSHFLIAGPDWNEALAWQAINYLRGGLDESEKVRRRELALKMLIETDERRFWRLFAKDGAYAFGYLEAKFEGCLPLAAVESIEVEKKYLSEVLSWPEAQIFRHRIRAQQE